MQNSEVEQLTNKLQGLINNLSPQSRRQLIRQIGNKLVQSQRQRIARQQNPDGSFYARRKQQKRTKTGRIKQLAMFKKLRTSRFLKTRINDKGVEIGFNSRAAKIASIHQYGKTGVVNSKIGLKVKYTQRELLGFSKTDKEMIEDLIIKQLSL
ncbi:phage virion morphogenesis protein [Mergibacter septicus]|uniref:Phage virion morphogenesis protein n=1 Tax=Mergibacter septicus TaxID=221402 RepID=A0A8D4LNE2_9PAST|nr:phage virion morphogenesis protein [Mergibacter septicus]AWX15603.1 phage virion morphogenesis protein [Mergibacter septicus]QDJ14857.1 phage virion morphogenesis protein [Mergibacter septicus]UTU47715.1 phage virion morphogenesis protein [Mergibacter septicus]WMR96678.1 phage virion morphogenesis protein [Mergibacter septicus]